MTVLRPTPIEVFVVTWGGGYDTPQYAAFLTAPEAWKQAREWEQEIEYGIDTIDVLKIDLNSTPITITRLDELDKFVADQSDTNPEFLAALTACRVRATAIANGRSTKKCRFCSQDIWDINDDGTWIDATDGDGCPGNDTLTNENGAHQP